MTNPQVLPRSAKDAAPASGHRSRSALEPPEIALSLQPRTPARCRAFAQRALAASGSRISRDVVDSVMIVAAELVTASYLGEASRVRVAIDVRQRDLTVTVRDDRPGDRQLPPSTHDTREMLLDALTVERWVFTEGAETIHVARMLVSTG